MNEKKLHNFVYKRMANGLNNFVLTILLGILASIGYKYWEKERVVDRFIIILTYILTVSLNRGSQE